MAKFPVVIGGIVLRDVETPETFVVLGAYQAAVVHDFPGGIRTIRNLGAFPYPLSWRGLMSGPDAIDRQVQLERLAVTGQTVKLTYARWALLGEVVSFQARPKTQWLIPYTITFMPARDLTGVISKPRQSKTAERVVADQQNALVGLQNGTAGAAAQVT